MTGCRGIMDDDFEDTDTYAPLQSKWLERRVLDPLHEVNERCIELLIDSARSCDQRNGWTADLINHSRALLCTMNSAACIRASKSPFLLVDFGFQDLKWWQQLMRHPEKAARNPTWLPCFQRRQDAVKLARTALVLAWYTARLNRELAIVLLGLAPAVADVIATLRMQQIDRIAERQFRHVRPRWEDHPAMWQQLLRSAQSGDVDSVCDFNVRGIQLLTSELMSQRQ